MRLNSRGGWGLERVSSSTNARARRTVTVVAAVITLGHSLGVRFSTIFYWFEWEINLNQQKTSGIVRLALGFDSVWDIELIEIGCVCGDYVE
ncbi:hypothetical protein Tco_0243079 [Tanacetum coccineum]